MINALRKSKVRLPRNHVLPLENLDLRNRNSKTIITTEDEESVQKKLDIETVKEGEVKERREVLRRHSKRTLIIPISTTTIHIL